MIATYTLNYAAILGLFITCLAFQYHHRLTTVEGVHVCVRKWTEFCVLRA